MEASVTASLGAISAAPLRFALRLEALTTHLAVFLAGAEPIFAPSRMCTRFNAQVQHSPAHGNRVKQEATTGTMGGHAGYATQTTSGPISRLIQCGPPPPSCEPMIFSFQWIWTNNAFG